VVGGYEWVLKRAGNDQLFGCVDLQPERSVCWFWRPGSAEPKGTHFFATAFGVHVGKQSDDVQTAASISISKITDGLVHFSVAGEAPN